MSETAARAAREASHVLQSANASDKAVALQSIYKVLESSRERILDANAQDLAIARKRVAEGSLSESLVKRLDLTLPGKWESLLEGIQQVEALDDPTGKVQLATQLDEGLDLYRVSCPIGVLLIIFEARPEVVVQISCLAIKSGVSLWN
jgi:glutamate-5-semialdehyde dehydrogenase